MQLLLHYYYYYYHYDVRPAHEAAHGGSRAKTRAGPCTPCIKKSGRAFKNFAAEIMYFPGRTPSAYYIVQRIISRSNISVVLPGYVVVFYRINASTSASVR